MYLERGCILEWTTGVSNENVTVDLQCKAVCYVLYNGACRMEECQDSDI